MKSFLTRLVSGIVLLAIIISTGIVGGPVLFGFTFLISLIGYWEFLKVFGLEKKLPGVFGLVFAVLYYGTVYLGDAFNMAGPLLLVGFLMVLMAIYVFTFPKFRTDEITAPFFGLVYVAVMLSFLYQTRMIPIEGRDTPIVYFLIFICSWGCDTCAYAVGMLIGKHKLAPVLSPKKSIEGAVGGVVGSALLGLAYGAYFGHNMEEVANPMVACAIACAIAAVISQIGDLAASAIKRNHNIKDYGHLIPGHGGILDRFDSMIFTAPAIYFAVTFLR